MAITLTEEEKQLVKEGKLNPSNILEHRKINPIKTINVNDLEDSKKQIREANVHYKNSIQKNKDLYIELDENRKVKENWRNVIAELRIKKKKLLGLVD